MTFFKDLDICTYFPFECSNLISIGWLSPSHEFSKGDVTGDFYDKLCELLRDPWEPVATPGFTLPGGVELPRRRVLQQCVSIGLRFCFQEDATGMRADRHE